MNGNIQRTFCVGKGPFTFSTFSLYVIIIFSKVKLQALLVQFKQLCVHANLLVLCKVDFLKSFFKKSFKLHYDVLKAKKSFTLASSLIMETICASLKMALFFMEMLQMVFTVNHSKTDYSLRTVCFLK